MLFFLGLVFFTVVLPGAVCAWLYRRPKRHVGDLTGHRADALSDEATANAMLYQGQFHGGGGGAF